ncbi:LysR family transcriptional regulator [Aestuariibius sp. 2305UL40-4]|uniref:LysR family transcriptional regulator n=1 Tax=Aestuariibius violaceus TaxID=3234132 RepID=UPI00345EAC83
MEIEALRIVSLVAQQGSFAAAARVLDMDPSTVSRVVAGVERDLDLRLFQRTTRRLSVTEAGETFLRRVGPLVEEFDQAREAALEARTRPKGRVRLTASVAFGYECIVPHLAAVREALPEVTLDLVLTDQNVDLVGENIDLAVRLAPAPEGDLISRRLMTTRYRVCAAPAYLERFGRPERPAELSGHDCVRYDLPGFRTRWLFRDADGAVEEVPVGGTFVISNALALRRAVLEGVGVGLLAVHFAGEDLAAGRLVDLFPAHEVTATAFETGAWLLYPSRAYLPAKVRAVIDFLAERLR